MKVNGCKKAESKALPLKSPDSHEVILHKYTEGKRSSEVWLYEIKGGGHNWGYKDIDTAAEIWKFFAKFVR